MDDLDNPFAAVYSEQHTCAHGDSLRQIAIEHKLVQGLPICIAQFVLKWCSTHHPTYLSGKMVS